MLSFSLPKFILLFGAKLLFMLFMLLIAFPVLSSKIKLHMSTFFGSPPEYHHLHSFGFAYFVLLQSHEYNKLEPWLRFCCFLGYGKTQKGYRCYDQVEDELPNLELRSPAPTLLEDLAQDISPRHSTRIRSIPAHLLDYHCYTALAT